MNRNVLRALVLVAMVPLLWRAQTALAQSGACCQPGGTCITRLECDCRARGSTYMGHGTTCTPHPCAGIVYGACCLGSGPVVGCVVTTQAICFQIGGSGWQGQTNCISGFPPCNSPIRQEACCCGTGCVITDPALCTWAGGTSAPGACSPNPCVGPSGACCAGSTCTVVAQSSCAGFWAGAGTSCINTPCGTCCNPSTQSCTFTSQNACMAASGFWSSGGSCSATPCGACCSASGVCTYVTSPLCGGMFTPGGSCSPNPCAPLGECCTTTGSCFVTTQANCAGFWSLGGACSPNQCPFGACCNGTTCSMTHPLACAGTFFGGLCSPNPCLPPPTDGACCRGTCCTVTTPAACAFNFLGLGTVCAPSPCGSVMNDDCTTAMPLIAGMPLTDANCGARRDIQPSCGLGGPGGGSDRHVWFFFHSTHDALYEVNSCGSLFDTVLAVYDASLGCASPVEIACNDDSASGGNPCVSGPGQSRIDAVRLPEGPHFIQLGSAGAGSPGGEYTVVIFPLHPLGVCCDPSTGACRLTDVVTCPTPNQFIPNPTLTCAPNPCIGPGMGACCDCCTGGCSFVASAACAGPTQRFIPGTACSPTPCLAPCCQNPAGAACAVTTRAQCPIGPGVTWLGIGDQCGPPRIQDLFDFLAAYFGGFVCDSDCTGDCQLTVGDIFCFLAGYFGGCI